MCELMLYYISVKFLNRNYVPNPVKAPKFFKLFVTRWTSSSVISIYFIPVLFAVQHGGWTTQKFTPKILLLLLTNNLHDLLRFVKWAGKVLLLPHVLALNATDIFMNVDVPMHIRIFLYSKHTLCDLVIFLQASKDMCESPKILPKHKA